MQRNALCRIYLHVLINRNITISDGRQLNAKIEKTKQKQLIFLERRHAKEKRKTINQQRGQKENRNPNNPSLEVSYPEEKKIHAQVYVWTPDKHKDRQDTRAPVIYPLIIVGKKEETRKKNRINPVRNQPRRSTRVENADQKNIVGK